MEPTCFLQHPSSESDNAQPDVACNTGSQPLEPSLASIPRRGAGRGAGVEVRKFVTSAPDADEIDTARLLVQLADARMRGDQEVVVLVGRVLMLKHVVAGQKDIIDRRDRALRTTIREYRASRQAA